MQPDILFLVEWFFLLLVVVIAYGVGVEVEKIRQGERDSATAQERERQRVAALSSEDRLSEERKRLRDLVIHNLKPEDRVLFAVYQPNNPKTIELEKKVNVAVDEMLKSRGLI